MIKNSCLKKPERIVSSAEYGRSAWEMRCLLRGSLGFLEKAMHSFMGPLLKLYPVSGTALHIGNIQTNEVPPLPLRWDGFETSKTRVDKTKKPLGLNDTRSQTRL